MNLKNLNRTLWSENSAGSLIALPGRLFHINIRSLMKLLPILIAIVAAVDAVDAAVPRFVQGINLNGPALVVDGRAWDGTNATNVVISGKRFENQAVALKPATDPKRAQMITAACGATR